jgi:hypothetical protein
VKRPQLLKYDHRLASDRPECAALIGEIAAAWSRLEITLAVYFAQIANISVDFGHGVSDHILTEAVDSVTSLPQRSDLLLIAARRRFDNATVENLGKLLKKIRDTGKQRNKIVHARWMIADDHPNEVWYTKRFGSDLSDLEVFDTHKLGGVLDLIRGRQEELHIFYEAELLPRLKALRQ